MALPLLKTVQVPQLQFIDNFVDIPVVVVQRQGTMVLSVQRPEIPQVLFVAILVGPLLCDDRCPWSQLC